MRTLKLYLDMCVFNRPFDDQEQDRIALETSAFLYVLEMIEKGRFSIMCSEAHIYENNKNPYIFRKERVFSYLDLAPRIIKVTRDSVERSRFLQRFGFSPLDSLHIALAEKSGANYFITVDDDIIKMYNKHKQEIEVSVLSLLNLISREV